MQESIRALNLITAIFPKIFNKFFHYTYIRRQAYINTRF